MSGKTSFGPIIAAELIDEAEMQPYLRTYSCLPFVMSWDRACGTQRAYQSTCGPFMDANVKWGMSAGQRMWQSWGRAMGRHGQMKEKMSSPNLICL